MKTTTPFLFLSLCIIFLSCSNYPQFTSVIDMDLPFALKKQAHFGNRFILPFDIDKDGKDELLYIEKKEKISFSMSCYRDIDKFSEFQVNFPECKIETPPFLYWDNYDRLNILVPLVMNNVACIKHFNSKGDSLGFYKIKKGIDRNGNGFWDGQIRIVAVADINEDGNLDIIIQILTAYDLYPRGIYVFDLKNNRKIWEFLSGARVSYFEMSDITNDGVSEILLGSSAPDNGANSNNFDDEHSYLIILNQEGTILKHLKMGSRSSVCRNIALDVDGTNAPKLVTLVSHGTADMFTEGRLTIWEGVEIKKKCEKIGDFNSALFEGKDINMDGKDEIIVLRGLNRKIVIYNNNLEVIVERSIEYEASHILLEDLNSDGTIEIIVSGGGHTVVYNNKLKPIAHSQQSGRLSLAKQGYGFPKMLLIYNEGNGGGFVLQRNIRFYSIRTVWIFLGILIGSLILLFILFIILGALPRHRYLHLFIELLNNFDCAAFLLDKKGKVVISKGNINEFIDQKELKIRGFFYTKIFNTEKTRIITSFVSSLLKAGEHSLITKSKELPFEAGKHFRVDVHPIMSHSKKLVFILVCIQDISKQKEGERAIEWASISQKLTHEIKNPLHTVLLTLQRLQMVYQEDKVKNIKTYNKYTNSVFEEIERLRKITDGFMRFTKQKPPEFEIIPAEKLIKRIEDKTRDWLPQQVQFKVDAEKDLPDLRVDFEQMQQLFFNIFDNAVKAMSAKGRLSLRVTTAERITSDGDGMNGEVIVFEVSDTGSGIPTDKIPKLFDAYLSFREGGTGLGLTICKKIVEDHRGQISIQSLEGVGTTVKIKITV
jgi:nitrogen-specific signal transduction histidine kinase